MPGALTRPLLGLTVVAALCAGCGGEDAKATDESSSETSLTLVCASGDLAVTTGRVMSVSSQPFVAVELRNEGRQRCAIEGYPRVTADGVSAGGRTGVLAVREKHGDLYERKDPGRQLVLLEPGEAAVFHVGTSTAYDVGTQTITQLRIHLPDVRGRLTVPLQLEASRPPMRRIPLGVTALQHEDDVLQ